MRLRVTRRSAWMSRSLLISPGTGSQGKDLRRARMDPQTGCEVFEIELVRLHRAATGCQPEGRRHICC
jgi:hypothetical protein